MTDPLPICALCGRPIPPTARQSRHHLVPKLRGGKGGATVILHQICHNEIHAALTEAELARDYADIARLRAHPRIARFVAWVRKRPPGFHSKTPGPRRSRRYGALGAARRARHSAPAADAAERAGGVMGVDYIEHVETRLIEVVIDGGIGKADIDRIMPAIEAFIESHGAVSVLEIVRGLGWVNVPAALPHVGLGIKATAMVKRAALVTDLAWLSGVTRIVAPVSPIEIRVFPLSEEVAARAWLAAPAT